MEKETHEAIDAINMILNEIAKNEQYGHEYDTQDEIIDKIEKIAGTINRVSSLMTLMLSNLAKKTISYHMMTIKRMEDITYYYPVANFTPEKNGLSIYWRKNELYRDKNGKLCSKGKHISKTSKGSYSLKAFSKATPLELDAIKESEEVFDAIRKLQEALHANKKSIMRNTEKFNGNPLPNVTVRDMIEK